jgi:hypothetical protein
LDIEEEYEPSWYPYEGGITIGEFGPEKGFILQDEEYGDPEDDEDSDARITLEQGRADNPGFFLTAALYGWLFHTYRCESESIAKEKYVEIKAELEQLTELLPYEGERDVSGKSDILVKAVSDFEKKYA